MRQGLFVTFEGIDGSGKSTQLELCAAVLRQAGHEVVITRNPGGTDFGLELRQILLHHPGQVFPTSELLLFIADRAQHMNQIVFPALAEGQIVLCDRHLDSTVAYQGYGRGLDRTMIDALNHIAIQGRMPDLTLLYDGPPEVLALRVSKRGQADRLEAEAAAFHQCVREGYLAIAREQPGRLRVLDATQSIEALQAQTLTYIQAALQPA